MQTPVADPVYLPMKTPTYNILPTFTRTQNHIEIQFPSISKFSTKLKQEYYMIFNKKVPEIPPEHIQTVIDQDSITINFIELKSIAPKWGVGNWRRTHCVQTFMKSNTKILFVFFNGATPLLKAEVQLLVDFRISRNTALRESDWGRKVSVLVVRKTLDKDGQSSIASSVKSWSSKSLDLLFEILPERVSKR